MNWDQIKGQWHQVASKVHSRWGRVANDDMTNMTAKRMLLLGRLQERYGLLKDDAEKQVDGWMAKVSSGDGARNADGTDGPRAEKAEKSS
jgi:uncharacterized protein YjbJ (UPF0337 family)